MALFLIYQQKNRKGILVAKLTADVFWVAHYLCLGAFGGAIPNFVGIFRELVFLKRKEKRWAGLVFWPVFFICLNLGIGAFTFRSPINVLPIAASALVTVALWLDRPLITKLLSLPVSVSFLVYDIFIGSQMGVINEAISILSIIIFLIRRKTMSKGFFSQDVKTEKELSFLPRAQIGDAAKTLSVNVAEEKVKKGDAFAQEITEGFVADFERSEDKMAHVSTFMVIDGTVYMTYYANTKEPSEDPKNQTARIVYAPIDDIENKTFIDLQTTGDTVGGEKIDMVYDTILMRKDENTLFILWTARIDSGNYYRFYCPFDIAAKTLGEIGVNRLKIGDVVNDFSFSGIRTALAANNLPCKTMYSDIGIMQKLSSRVENGETYYYSGCYSGDFNCIIKSKDLITWEYVSQPDFINESKWENATYVLNDKVYYFVRQHDGNPNSFLTVYDLEKGIWEKPVEIGDCQSRGDFIMYKGDLYLFHAPIDREHIGIVKIDTKDIAKSEILLQAKMHTSCFYPFVQYFENGELAMSYTVARKHIRLAKFTLSKYL